MEYSVCAELGKAGPEALQPATKISRSLGSVSGPNSCPQAVDVSLIAHRSGLASHRGVLMALISFILSSRSSKPRSNKAHFQRCGEGSLAPDPVSREAVANNASSYNLLSIHKISLPMNISDVYRGMLVLRKISAAKVMPSQHLQSIGDLQASHQARISDAQYIGSQPT